MISPSLNFFRPQRSRLCYGFVEIHDHLARRGCVSRTDPPILLACLSSSKLLQSHVKTGTSIHKLSLHLRYLLRLFASSRFGEDMPPTSKNGKKDFSCKFCDRRFARLEHLQRHIRTRQYSLSLWFCFCSPSALTCLYKTPRRNLSGARATARLREWTF